MNRRFLLSGAAALVLSGGMVPSAEAQDGLRNRNRFSLNSRFTFLIDADFTSSTPVNDIGPAPPAGVATTPGQAGTIIRQYDDGFVGVDVSGNAGDTTWFWGYEDASQVAGVGTAGATLMFHSAASPADQFTRESEDTVLPGFDFGYARELWSFDVFGGRKAYGGLGFSFGYTDLSLKDSGTAAGTVTLTTDTFGIGAAIIPPGPPYSGTVAGPGPVIQDSDLSPAFPVTRTAAAAASTAAVINDVEGQLYGATIGPFLEIPLSERIIAEVNAGLALAYADRTYSFSETVMTTGAPAVSRSGAVSSGDLMVGGTIKAGLGYLVRDNIGLNLGVQYQYVGTSSQSVLGKTAKLDLRSAVSVLFGLNWTF